MENSDWEHYEKYHIYAHALGVGALITTVNSLTKKNNLKKCYKEDRHLNNIPLHLWDRSGGMVKMLLGQSCNWPDKETIRKIEPYRADKDLAGRWFSPSFAVCVLKHVAIYEILKTPIPENKEA